MGIEHRRRYPLVNVNIAIENHRFSWDFFTRNDNFRGYYVLNYQRVLNWQLSGFSIFWDFLGSAKLVPPAGDENRSLDFQRLSQNGAVESPEGPEWSRDGDNQTTNWKSERVCTTP